MLDDPISEAIRQIPHNELTIEGGASDKGGARISGAFEREKNGRAVGVEAQIEQKAGWSVAGFFRKIWQ